MKCERIGLRQSGQSAAGPEHAIAIHRRLAIPPMGRQRTTDSAFARAWGCALVVLLAFTSACRDGLDGSPSWTENWGDSATFSLAPSPGQCGDCIESTLLVTLGDRGGEGFIVDRGQLGTTLEDDRGRFWVPQRDHLKVFDAGGNYLQTVGRPGQGPLEFQYAFLSHQDSSGYVHAFDVLNARESLINPTFELAATRTTPGWFQTSVALDDNRYAIQMEVHTPDRLGLPLHIVEEGKMIRSFGAPAQPGTSPIVMSVDSKRVLARGPDGVLLAAKPYDYEIVAWSENGERLARFVGQPLSAAPPDPGPRTWENPPAAEIAAMLFVEPRYVWVAIRKPRPRWQELVEEVVSSDGVVAIRPKDGVWADAYMTRIEILDLAGGTVVAWSDLEELIVRFLPGPRAVALSHDDAGDARLTVSQLAVRQ